MFQSTHPRGVRHHWEPVPDSGASFNPRTRVGCDQVLRDQGVEPDKGFNPRTRVGCDPVALMRLYNLFLFQSTHPRGVRPHQGARPPASGIVSIHAPAWGATFPRRDSRSFRVCFNPRTRVGCDPSITASAPSPHLFQSTHPRGVRQAHAAELMPSLGVSIHAPAWGATGCSGTRASSRTRVSIHAPAWGATSGTRAVPATQGAVSIHAPAWGATLQRAALHGAI